jgi:hypothetical protein
MRYWRDPDSNSVFQYRGEPDKYEVVVIPRASWDRLVDLLDDEPLDNAEKWLEVEAILSAYREGAPAEGGTAEAPGGGP